jgi:putative CocE/NonD family hydrolase
VRPRTLVLVAAAALAALALARPLARWLRRPVPPPPARWEVRRVEGERVRMRDGVELATDLYLPVGAPPPWPAVLIRTPYDRTAFGGDARIFAGQGYAVAVQDVRGRWGSPGTFRLSSRQEAEDGYDALTWLAARPWSNGRVGTYGCSYSAEVQYMLAALRHPNHAAAIAQNGGGAWRGGASRLFGFSRGGAFELATAFGWFRRHGSRTFPPAPLPDVDAARALAHLPVVDVLKASGAPPTDFEELVRFPPGDPHWSYLGDLGGGERFDVPTLHVGSWYDLTPAATLSLFEAMRAGSTSQRARDGQFLVMSPAAHCQSEELGALEAVGTRRVGDPRLDYHGLYLRFFDHYLRGAENGIEAEPRVRLFTMGDDLWRAAETWPLPGAHAEAWYLRGGGRANGRGGDGRLERSPPGDEPPDRYTYDPADPVPSRGVTCCAPGVTVVPGSHDQSDLEDRPDVLVYTTAPLAEPVEVTGRISLDLWVASSAPDTDFTAKLVDVLPDGRAFNVQEGVLRARHREGLDRTVRLRPGEVVPVRIDLEATSNVFRTGHRIRLEVASSSFPRWDRNLNTGGPNFDEVRGVPARNEVHHSAARPSRLLLPVVPRGGR